MAGRIDRVGLRQLGVATRVRREILMRSAPSVDGPRTPLRQLAGSYRVFQRRPAGSSPPARSPTGPCLPPPSPRSDPPFPCHGRCRCPQSRRPSEPALAPKNPHPGNTRPSECRCRMASTPLSTTATVTPPTLGNLVCLGNPQRIQVPLPVHAPMSALAGAGSDQHAQTGSHQPRPTTPPRCRRTAAPAGRHLVRIIPQKSAGTARNRRWLRSGRAGPEPPVVVGSAPHLGVAHLRVDVGLAWRRRQRHRCRSGSC